MNSHRYYSATLALVLCVGSAFASTRSHAKQAPGMACDARQDICAFLETYFDALDSRDWEAFRETLDDNITVMFDRPGPPERRDGREAVGALFRRIFPPTPPAKADLPAPLNPEDLMVQDLGNSAVVSFHLRSEGEISRRTLVLQKKDGHWRVVHIHASSSDLQKLPEPGQKPGPRAQG